MKASSQGDLYGDGPDFHQELFELTLAELSGYFERDPTIEPVNSSPAADEIMSYEATNRLTHICLVPQHAVPGVIKGFYRQEKFPGFASIGIPNTMTITPYLPDCMRQVDPADHTELRSSAKLPDGRKITFEEYDRHTGIAIRDQSGQMASYSAESKLSEEVDAPSPTKVSIEGLGWWPWEALCLRLGGGARVLFSDFNTTV
ncbi:MAG: hypothetical protein ABIE22_00095 [archaeon]